ncbi:hypothetical protein ACWEGE_05135 [Amycolatopsis sp. NPDC004747]
MSPGRFLSAVAFPGWFERINAYACFAGLVVLATQVARTARKP